MHSDLLRDPLHRYCLFEDEPSDCLLRKTGEVISPEHRVPHRGAGVRRGFPGDDAGEHVADGAQVGRVAGVGGEPYKIIGIRCRAPRRR